MNKLRNAIKSLDKKGQKKLNKFIDELDEQGLRAVPLIVDGKVVALFGME